MFSASSRAASAPAGSCAEETGALGQATRCPHPPTCSPTARARHRGGLGLLGRLGLAGLPAGVALAAIGTATALAVGATATIAVTSQHHHKESVTVSAPGPTPSGSAPEQPGSSTPSTSPAATDRSTHPAASNSISASPTPSGLLHAATSINSSSNVYWAQLDLSVTVKQPVTALDVRVRVSNCTGLAATGSWSSGSPGQFTETTTKNADGSITYEFQLAPGHQIAPGTVTFAVQFNHATTGWNAADDTYHVAAGTAGSTSAETGTSAAALTLPAYSITVLKLSGSSSASASAAPSTSASCTVTTTKTHDWGAGCTENMTIKNTVNTAVSAWKSAFAFPGNEKITQAWNATYHLKGKAVIAHPVSYDRTIAAGASLTIGYTATYSGADTPPTWYSLNGVRCG
ncbi:cellulose binding domain-containing protein [Streptomyces sp. 846.5]|nr:cellulose binding domain-containing protein [Streptomyces sp. 846.5]TDT97941.1 cellulose binding domain-containing protein [Streptomyces sp. 846.5]